jgi:broad specificity phosphatase PhoE
VTHGGLCNVLFNHVLGNADGEQREFSFGNASIHTFEVTGDQWSVISMNETAHLQDIDTQDRDDERSLEKSA